MKKHNYAGNEYGIASLENILNFIFAGDAIFTLKSEKTGNHYTYRMSKVEDAKNLYFVSLLTGPDVFRDYTYMGKVKDEIFSLTAKSTYKETSLPVMAFDIFFYRIKKYQMHSQMKFYHMGICGKCGRALTDPESIEAGIGPICAGTLIYHL